MNKVFSKLLMVSMLAFISLLTSCETKVSETITFQSADERLKLEVFGTRSNSFDPWVMTIKQVLSDSVVAEASIEAYIDEPTSEYVKVKWKNDHDAVVTFLERENEVKSVPVSIRF